MTKFEHQVYSRDIEGDMVLVATMEHNGEYQMPLQDKSVLEFDEDYEPIQEEGDKFYFGYLGRPGEQYPVFVVVHADGNSASFVRQQHLFFYQRDRAENRE